jgi:hypothetical protein
MECFKTPFPQELSLGHADRKNSSGHDFTVQRRQATEKQNAWIKATRGLLERS